ncbi:putative serine/threonine protein kinase [Aspergillus indologenus CBS 114.80]|uniref:Putative serine/threonine protein kinase n=1 Tax=Aspergillus indologenus CBS 114.80 TaxID=1450541 RepID=A0A2V5HX94_9EURO|nr:putative serine/threonine protein kinase [Aspergillus indologenus CBS 114.80]
MTSSLRVGRNLRGQRGLYTIAKQIQGTVWLANRDGRDQPVIVKSVRHFRLQNERDVLKRFQQYTPFLRPLVDQIVEPSDPPAIVLKYLDDNLLNASASSRLTKGEVRYVARGILEALDVLHRHNFVHTDIKPDNILVNYGSDGSRFKDVQVADCGSTVSADSAHAKDGDLIGAPIWRSPEAHLRIGWGPATDIWSFGATLVSLLYGGNFFLFKPDISAEHDDYELKILQRQCEFFGPFPLTYRDLCPRETLNVLAYVMRSIPPEKKKPFMRISEKELITEDKEFITRIMKLDPRDRPSAAELLQDKWFNIKG